MQGQDSSWTNLRIAITGASGSLGKALIKKFKEKGANVTGLTSSQIDNKKLSDDNPNQWVKWDCGKEYLLDDLFKDIDILIINHGVNFQGSQKDSDINKSIEINALSAWRLIERFECSVKKLTLNNKKREIWINTSEAEIQPALSPTYELSKRLLGNIVSLKISNCNFDKNSNIKLKKIILGPFKSNLNPIGILKADFVANQILKIADNTNGFLIIVSPNPISYLLIPINELARLIYFKLTRSFYSLEKG